MVPRESVAGSPSSAQPRPSQPVANVTDVLDLSALEELILRPAMALARMGRPIDAASIAKLIGVDASLIRQHFVIFDCVTL